MGKKIGKIQGLLVFGLYCGLLFSEAEVRLQITDQQGEPLEQAQAKVPFLIQVTVSDDTSNLPQPQIKGLEQFSLQGTSQSESVSIINGAKTVSRSFQVGAVALEPGNFVVGPAFIDVNGETKQSAAINLKVADKVKTAQGDSEQAFSVISFDKSSAYIGEKLLFTLRFYYSDNRVKLAKMQEPAFENFGMSQLKGPVSGTRTVDGNQYRYLEWTAEVFPEKTGTLLVDPVGAIYTVPGRGRGGDLFGGFSDFFGGIRNKKQLYSNTLKIEIEPLPVHTPPVKAVGNFSSIVANLNNNSAQEGEGVVLTLDLIGAGNIERLSHPALELPIGLTYYESSTQIVPEGTEFKKTFEYIVQGLEPGTYTVPAQQFTYFDAVNEQFKYLNTNPVMLRVNQGSSGVATPSVGNQEKNISEKTQLTILQGGAWLKPRIRTFPFLIWLALLLTPVLIWLVLFFLKKRQEYLILNAPELRYKGAFKKARTDFHNARAGNYDSQLYHIFIELFSARLRRPPSEISEQLIEDTLRKAKVSDTDLVKWRLLFAHMVEKAFSSYGATARNDGLFNQGAHWINELEKLL